MGNDLDAGSYPSSNTITSTKAIAERGTLKWTIDNVFNVVPFALRPISSTRMHSASGSWWIKLYPGGLSGTRTGCWLGLLSSVDCPVDYTVWILDGQGKKKACIAKNRTAILSTTEVDRFAVGQGVCPPLTPCQQQETKEVKQDQTETTDTVTETETETETESESKTDKEKVNKTDAWIQVGESPSLPGQVNPSTTKDGKTDDKKETKKVEATPTPQNIASDPDKGMSFEDLIKTFAIDGEKLCFQVDYKAMIGFEHRDLFG